MVEGRDAVKEEDNVISSLLSSSRAKRGKKWRAKRHSHSFPVSNGEGG